MIEFTRCPKCRTLYELDGVDLEMASGWVQCGDCDRKFKAISHAVEPDELSFVTVTNYDMDQSMKMEGAVSEDLVESSMHIVNNSLSDKSEEHVDKHVLNQEQHEEPDENIEKNESVTELKKNVRKHKQSNINVNVSVYKETDSPVFESITHSTNDLERKQLSEQIHLSDSEFLEKTIILPNEVSTTEDEDENYEFIFNNYSEDIFNPELIDGQQEEDHAGGYPPNDNKFKRSKKKNTYAELHSEFSEEEIEVDTEFPEKTILEEVLESNTVSHTFDQSESTYHDKGHHKANGLAKVFLRTLTASVLGLCMIGIIGVFALQLHSRGTIPWIPQNTYDSLLRSAPFLAKFEKSQIDLSAIHLASTRMESHPDNPSSRIITLQLINRSYTNQAYPDFQLEFTDAQGQTIARKIILPSSYLAQGHLGLLEPRQAKIVYLNLESLPLDAVGYQIKVVQQSSV